MPSLPVPEVAVLLREFGQRTALRGGNPYRAKAYTRAAENLLALTEPLEDLIAEGRLKEIPGIGDAIADIIAKLHKTGDHPSLQAMRKEIPSAALEMLAIPGLRPDKVLKLYQELGISSVDELETAAKADRLKSVKGLGAALQTKILQGIEIMRKGEGRRHIHRAAMLLHSAQEQLRKSKINQVLPAGDFRRGCELVVDLAMVVETSHLEGSPRRLESNSQISVWLTDKRRLGATLMLATGSQEHIGQLRDLAAKKNMTLDETGLHCGRKVVARKEEEIYARLGLQFIEPELREGLGEVELAKKNKIPRLVTDQDIRGILHAHTDRSDGVNTLEVMAEATRRECAWPVQARPKGANRSYPAGRCKPPNDHSGSHDGPTTASPPRLRHRRREGPSRLRKARRCGRDQRKSLASGFGLALASGRSGAWLYDEHQSGCPLHLGD